MILLKMENMELQYFQLWFLPAKYLVNHWLMIFIYELNIFIIHKCFKRVEYNSNKIIQTNHSRIITFLLLKNKSIIFSVHSWASFFGSFKHSRIFFFQESETVKCRTRNCKLDRRREGHIFTALPWHSSSLYFTHKYKIDKFIRLHIRN